VISKLSGINWKKDIPSIIEAANAKEPYKKVSLGFFISPIKHPKVCPTKISDIINNMSSIFIVYML
jgi:hypothetical protein